MEAEHAQKIFFRIFLEEPQPDWLLFKIASHGLFSQTKRLRKSIQSKAELTYYLHAPCTDIIAVYELFIQAYCEIRSLLSAFLLGVGINAITGCNYKQSGEAWQTTNVGKQTKQKLKKSENIQLHFKVLFGKMFVFH